MARRLGRFALLLGIPWCFGFAAGMLSRGSDLEVPLVIGAIGLTYVVLRRALLGIGLFARTPHDTIALVVGWGLVALLVLAAPDRVVFFALVPVALLGPIAAVELAYADGRGRGLPSVKAAHAA